MQTKPEYLDQLIDLASAKAGSDYKLAQHLHTSRQAVSMWRHGKQPCPVGDVALMAQIAGLDPEAWTLRAVAEQYRGTEKGAMLMEALKKALLATGAVIASSGADAAQIALNLPSDTLAYFIRCINSSASVTPVAVSLRLYA